MKLRITHLETHESTELPMVTSQQAFVVVRHADDLDREDVERLRYAIAQVTTAAAIVVPARFDLDVALYELIADDDATPNAKEMEREREDGK